MSELKSISFRRTIELCPKSVEPFCSVLFMSDKILYKESLSAVNAFIGSKIFFFKFIIINQEILEISNKKISKKVSYSIKI